VKRPEGAAQAASSPAEASTSPGTETPSSS
jgi:hypothetical protein